MDALEKTHGNSVMCFDSPVMQCIEGIRRSKGYFGCDNVCECVVVLRTQCYFFNFFVLVKNACGKMNIGQ